MLKKLGVGTPDAEVGTIQWPDLPMTYTGNSWQRCDVHDVVRFLSYTRYKKNIHNKDEAFIAAVRAYWPDSYEEPRLASPLPECSLSHWRGKGIVVGSRNKCPCMVLGS